MYAIISGGKEIALCDNPNFFTIQKYIVYSLVIVYHHFTTKIITKSYLNIIRSTYDL